MQGSRITTMLMKKERQQHPIAKEEVIAEVYRAKKAFLSGICKIVLPSEAEDVFQIGAVKIFKNLDKFDGKNWFAWSYSIMKNVAIDEYRKRMNKYGKQRMVELTDDVAEMEDLFQYMEISEWTDERLKVLRQIQRAMKGLTPKSLELLKIMYWREMSVPEISEETGISQESLHKRMTRIRRYLREKS
jgi:RNA polymerase sigma factor (sigma-70 family)